MSNRNPVKARSFAPSKEMEKWKLLYESFQDNEGNKVFVQVEKERLPPLTTRFGTVR